MIDKERLEEIKNSYLVGIHRLFGTSWVSMPKENFDWLIQQAERVEKLEEERDEWKDTAQYYYMTNQELREQNKRYRKAINYIIEKVMLFGTNEEVYEAIQDATKALEGDND
jgi:hypothetical protein